MEEKSIVRQNMMDDKNYRAYCGSMKCINMPRIGHDFKCPECGWEVDKDTDFFKRYNKKHNL